MIAAVRGRIAFLRKALWCTVGLHDTGIVAFGAEADTCECPLPRSPVVDGHDRPRVARGADTTCRAANAPCGAGCRAWALYPIVNLLENASGLAVVCAGRYQHGLQALRSTAWHLAALLPLLQCAH